ncbi:extracellular solute-binding protein [Cocleimonas sp. KMM 6892]|uniref:extracellular solute-binding protein n=1 Tax=unclassified Cocleimonas TaxID=2639732 RepID=UPI002DB94435|nr:MULTISPECIES: extracellular solute-binding protein [unclassified Cocleimonas]MEB8431364.1 extracellular solute-binding protein [Cocleimonas sp. KMM 6892]MEC4713864.1 extracellular solute-binding protein [Cocleimonas sp. KMM 6895]MEC4743195.1 extracellular solute-binding protein [Cocleimonas sp. KMM 6896]
MKKMKAFNQFFIFLLCSYFSTTLLYGQSELTIATWGGSYENAQQTALFQPFEVATGTLVNTQKYSADLAILNSDLLPDIIDMTLGDALIACDKKLIHKLDYKQILIKDKKHKNPKSDFVKHSILPCGIAHLSYSTLIAYDEREFTGEKPQTISDFFDIKRFPGKRALNKSPSDILEWALIAEGVPIDQIYDLLSTERGMRIAFRRLDSIRDEIIWWDNPKQAASLLSTGKAVMASGYNGRFFSAQLDGAPITMIWDAQIIDWNVWVIPKQKDSNSKTALKNDFIRFVIKAENMAKLAEIIPYGPSRKSALRRIGLHAEQGFSMRDQLPTATHHLDRALFRDANWYANTQNLRKTRFWDWLNQNKMGDAKEDNQ